MHEHTAVRTDCGVFDISHMGEVFVSGPDATSAFNSLLTNDVSRLKIGRGQYTLMLNAQGGVIDDLILYRTGEQSFFAVINAACIDEDVAWMADHFAGSDVKFENRSDDYSGIAVQGPKTAAYFDRLFLDAKLPARNGIAMIGDMIICRTGYTGEDGFELFCPHDSITTHFTNLIEAGATPCGLGARDSLRLEMGFPLNGNDLSPNRTPLDANLGRFVKLDKGDFIGRDILFAQTTAGLTHQLVGLRATGRGAPPREHYPVLDSTGATIGELTSGAFSPSLGVGIGMAYLPVNSAEVGTPLAIDIRGRSLPVEVVSLPFYTRP